MSKGGPHKAHYWMKEPEKCACGFGDDPAPWHCPACGRWKRSTDAVCEMCRGPVTLDDHWSEYWQAERDRAS